MLYILHHTALHYIITQRVIERIEAEIRALYRLRHREVSEVLYILHHTALHCIITERVIERIEAEVCALYLV